MKVNLSHISLQETSLFGILERENQPLVCKKRLYNGIAGK